ncbi:hypothetical protein [Aeoliella mucimassa]|uniref:Uncharacterized protein n=1 Tax=Aeoliella mucimassa TaxID=2527972 RepID=A0A518ALR3_9BACT|nr:hypothetical protein [Aeoliella mucimassa]QDU55659.1 hypothetical protein Pan181_18520 [Aeoliella mucimassa]
MAKRNEVDVDELADAIRQWTGYGSAPYPTRGDLTKSAGVDAERVAVLMPMIKRHEQEFYESKAHVVAMSLLEMKSMAIDDFQRKYPSLPESIAQAFAWCYTFDYK